ncbi:HMG box domain-containing protein [Plasmodiophora brassicae]
MPRSAADVLSDNDDLFDDEQFDQIELDWSPSAGDVDDLDDVLEEAGEIARQASERVEKAAAAAIEPRCGRRLTVRCACLAILLVVHIGTTVRFLQGAGLFRPAAPAATTPALLADYRRYLEQVAHRIAQHDVTQAERLAEADTVVSDEDIVLADRQARLAVNQDVRRRATRMLPRARNLWQMYWANPADRPVLSTAQRRHVDMAPTVSAVWKTVGTRLSARRLGAAFVAGHRRPGASVTAGGRPRTAGNGTRRVGEHVQRVRDRGAQAVQRILSFSQRSYRGRPHASVVVQVVVGWVALVFSWISYSDILFRVVTYARHAARVVAVRKRNMASWSFRARRSCAIALRHAHVVIVAVFLIVLTGRVAVDVGRVDVVGMVRQEVADQCQNYLRTTAAFTSSPYRPRPRPALIARLNRMRSALNADLDQIAAMVRDSAQGRHAPPFHIEYHPLLDPAQAHGLPVHNVTSGAPDHDAEIADACRTGRPVLDLQGALERQVLAYRDLIVAQIICFLLVHLVNHLVNAALRHWFWIDLTEGYTVDKPFTDDQVRQRARRHRQVAAACLALAIAAFLTVLIIGAR